MYVSKYVCSRVQTIIGVGRVIQAEQPNPLLLIMHPVILAVHPPSHHRQVGGCWLLRLFKRLLQAFSCMTGLRCFIKCRQCSLLTRPSSGARELCRSPSWHSQATIYPILGKRFLPCELHLLSEVSRLGLDQSTAQQQQQQHQQLCICATTTAIACMWVCTL
jgi:hypothetical protein